RCSYQVRRSSRCFGHTRSSPSISSTVSPKARGAVRRQLERDLGAPRPPDRVRAHAAVERLAAAQGPEGGAVVEPRGAVLVPEDRDLVSVAPATPEKLGAAHVEGRGDEDAHASAHDLVERR